MVEIDRTGPVPVYQQVADEIERRIRAGVLKPDLPIPSVTGLVQEFGIARGTALKVHELLAKRGLVVVVQGKGVFVIPQAASETSDSDES